MSFDLRTFRETLGLFVTGVTIITTRDEQGVHEERMIGVRFVPMTGEAEE